MAHLSKRTTAVRGHGGAGPFHHPQTAERAAARKLVGIAGGGGKQALRDLRDDRRAQLADERALAARFTQAGFVGRAIERFRRRTVRKAA